VGRHAAADGAGTDPIVAAALAYRPDGTPTRHAPDAVEATAQGTEGDLGWPGDTTTGGGLGWPGSLDRGPAGDEGDVTARMDAVPAVPGTGSEGEPEPTGPRGWRRLFGGTAA
jgi:hypothetical protein